MVFLTVFSLSHKKNPWSNETETICFINDALVPYIKRVKEEVPAGPKNCFNMGCFQDTINYKSWRHPCKLWHRNSLGAMTQLLQQLDQNGSLKKFGKKHFSECFLSSVLKELKSDPTCDVTLIKVGLYLFTLKPLYAEVMKNAYNYFASCRGKEAGSKASGIKNAIHETRTRQVNVIYLNLFT